LVLFWLAKRHPDYCLHGIDSDLGLVQQANLVAKEMVLSYPLFRVGDLTKMKLSHGQYDLICSSDVLEHIEDDVTVLYRFRFALNKTGKLILHLPLKHQDQWRFFPVFRKHVVSDHVRDEYLPKEIRSKLQSSGFEILDLSYGFGWQGELAFELNNLFWRYPILRAMLALLTFPLSLYLAYRDVNVPHPQGNSLVILAQPQT
jgi:SAM-dependent methyltransferase